MLLIASALSAVVVGDDGERYTTPTSLGDVSAADRPSGPLPTPCGDIS